LKITDSRYRRLPDGARRVGPAICQEIATMHGWDLQAKRGERSMTFDLSINPIGLAHE